MFKPARILQAGLLSFFIAGCAATQTPPALSTDQAATENDPPRLTKALAIASGDSQAGRSNYRTTDGGLAPWLQDWANEVAKTRDIPVITVENLLLEAEYNPTAARLMAPSKGKVKRSWVTYKKRFVDPIRIRAGIDFWKQNHLALEQAEKQYQVPASVIVAIIGVETVYGRHTGDFNVLDALATLGFSYPDNSRPERGELFRNQLADLIELHHQDKLDARSAYGSYAGAMGLPQFMPGSLMRFAVDGDDDGNIDLYTSIPDVVSSVANFLILHGWQPGLPIFVNATLPDQPQNFVDGGLEAKLTIAELQADGTRMLAPQPQAWSMHPVGVINLIDEPSGNVEYRIATENFYAITQYNRSYFYAASVAVLAAELSQQMAASLNNTKEQVSN